MATHTGLTVRIAGRILSVENDANRKVARVVLSDGGAVSDIERIAISVAAGKLAERARRFLGMGWRVEELQN